MDEYLGFFFFLYGPLNSCKSYIYTRKDNIYYNEAIYILKLSAIVIRLAIKEMTSKQLGRNLYFYKSKG